MTFILTVTSPIRAFLQITKVSVSTANIFGHLIEKKNERSGII